jgi:uncharacterized alpha-E superfamily protein
MLGKTANGLFWMFRYIERSENTARLVETGLRMALTRSTNASEEWASVVRTAAGGSAFAADQPITAQSAINFLLRDPDNPSSVLSVIDTARSNGRMVRTALTREVWEATNEFWMEITATLKRPVREQDLPGILEQIKNRGALVRGALHGTMLRMDNYDFSRLGTFLERADNTARILDVKYYVLLPSVSHVGSSLDNVQWETILRSVSAHRSYRWVYDTDYQPTNIADYLILNARMPRSLAYCYGEIASNLGYLEADYGQRYACHDKAAEIRAQLQDRSAQDIFEEGLHEFLRGFIRDNNQLGQMIDQAYRFTE